MSTYNVIEASPERYAAWDAWVMQHPYGRLFHTMRWMEDRPEGPTGLLLAFEGDQIRGGFSWHATQRIGVRRILPPKMTPHFGPLVDSELQESDRSQIYRQLLEACPSHDLIGLLVDADADAAIISSVLRTKRQIFPTRRKSLAPDEDSIASYGENIRRNIRHALAQGAKPAAEVDLDEAFALFASAYRQRGSSPKFTLDELRTIHGRLVLSGESVMIGVVDSNNFLAGALLLLCDRRSAYYIVSGTVRELLSGKAGALLVHLAIRYAQDRGLVFDFNGSSISGVMEFFDRFNPQAAEVHYLTRAQSLKGHLATIVGPMLGKRVL